MRQIAILSVISFFCFSLQASDESSVLEKLMNLSVYSNGILLQVHSGGCTYKTSFAIEHKVGFKNIHQISFWKVYPDNCLASLREGVDLFFTYQELGLKNGDSFEILNPIE